MTAQEIIISAAITIEVEESAFVHNSTALHSDNGLGASRFSALTVAILMAAEGVHYENA